jgi:hypothetical protein
VPQLVHAVAEEAQLAHVVSHGVHTVSADAEQAVLAKVPAAQTVQAVHRPPLRKWPAGQVTQSVGAGPAHVAQLPSQPEQTVLAAPVHAATVYCAEAQVAQPEQTPPERNFPPEHAEQSVDAPPVHVAQLDAHTAHTVSFCAVQAPLAYCPAPHVVQVLQTPASRYRPAPQLEHCDAPAPVHVVQLASHAAQTRSPEPPHAALWYCPDAHAPEQRTQAPPLGYRPPAQLVQSVAAGPLQVAQAPPHAEQTRSAVAPQVATRCSPAAHAPEHATQLPPLTYCPAGQLVHCVALGPLHVAQAALQLPQVRSAVLVHAVIRYCPAAHAPEQVRQAPPLRYFPPPHPVHAVAPGPLHDAQLASHAPQTRSVAAEHAALWYWLEPQGPEHAAQVSAAPSTR